MDISCCLNKFLSTSLVNISLYRWVSFCISIDLENKIYILTQDGKSQRIVDRSRSAKETGTYVNGTGVAYLGQDQDSNASKFNPFRSLSGELAEFQFFSLALSEKEMKHFTQCIKPIEKPSLISFKDIENDFDVNKVLLESRTKKYCDQVEAFYRIFNERKTFDDTAFFCHTLGGKLVQPQNPKQNEELFKLSSTSFLCKQNTTYFNDALWLALIVDSSNQTWTNYITGTPVNFTNFSPIERKSLDEYRCVTFYSCGSDSQNWHAKWLMRKCTDRRKTVCEFDGVPILRLRGLCKSSLIDRRYILPLYSQEPVFHGYFYSRIIPVDSFGGEDHGHWVIEREDMPHLKAATNRRSELHYPVGKKTWHIYNDVCEDSPIELKLTICKEGQFSCNDGSCIDLTNRCDLRFHCQDGSDEENCFPLILPGKYANSIPPPTLDNKEVNEISILVYILNILSINVETFHISLELYLRSSWIDSRLKFKNLKDDMSENNMEGLYGVIWTPEFNFLGPSNSSCDLTERKSAFSVIKQSEPLPDDDENVNEGD